MESNKINVAELLKDCPTGMELNCTMYDNVYFDRIDENNAYPIRCYVLHDGGKESISFTSFGTYAINKIAKCVIFPKGKTTWEGFQVSFKDGDIVATTNGIWIGITTGGKSNEDIPTYCIINSNNNFEAYLEDKQTCMFKRLATEEEKQKLFDAIKDNGYKWNAETKTLEKLIKPKFKVGDKITDGEDFMTIEYIDNEYYYNIKRDTVSRLFIKNQDNWKLVPDKFDITTLVPFESKVLVRNSDLDEWRGAFWSYLTNDMYGFNFDTTRGYYKQCIPYKGNEHLLGKTKNCADYYKIW